MTSAPQQEAKGPDALSVVDSALTAQITPMTASQPSRRGVDSSCEVPHTANGNAQPAVRHAAHEPAEVRERAAAQDDGAAIANGNEQPAVRHAAHEPAEVRERAAAQDDGAAFAAPDDNAVSQLTAPLQHAAQEEGDLTMSPHEPFPYSPAQIHAEIQRSLRAQRRARICGVVLAVIVALLIVFVVLMVVYPPVGAAVRTVLPMR